MKIRIIQKTRDHKDGHSWWLSCPFCGGEGMGLGGSGVAECHDCQARARVVENTPAEEDGDWNRGASYNRRWQWSQ